MLARAYAWVAEHGLVGKSGRMRPAVIHISKLEQQLSGYYGQAGLSPSSRRTLGLGAQKQSMALVLSDVDVDDDVEGVDAEDGDNDAT
jgi:phage terminase small subunit